MNSDKPVIRVKDVMSQDYTLVEGLKTIEEALGILRDNNATVLIIDKRHDDDEYGILLLSDIAKLVLAKDRSPARVNVYEIMAKPVISVPPEMDVRYCARLFDNFGLSTAPVLSDGKILGMVSYNEIVMKGLVPHVVS